MIWIIFFSYYVKFISLYYFIKYFYFYINKSFLDPLFLSNIKSVIVEFFVLVFDFDLAMSRLLIALEFYRFYLNSNYFYNYVY